MKKKDSVCIGDIYGKMLNSFKYHNLRESKGKNKNAFGEQPELVGKGPKTDGYNDALNDNKDCCDEDEESPKLTKRQQTTKTMEDKLKNPKLSKDQKDKLKKQISLRTAEEAEEELFFKESRKNNRSMVNSIMSKSVFDKLYSKVLKENFGQDDSDLDALGLDDATPDADLGDDFGSDEFGDDEGGDEVSFSLPRDLAQQLVDVLQGVLGGEEDVGDEFGGDDELDFGDDEGGDEFGDDEEDEMSFEEDEEVGTKTAPDKKKAYMGKDNKVSGPPKPKSGHAKADVTDDTNTTNGAPPIAALQGKNNQVPGSTLKKATDYFK